LFFCGYLKTAITILFSICDIIETKTKKTSTNVFYFYKSAYYSINDLQIIIVNFSDFQTLIQKLKKKNEL